MIKTIKFVRLRTYEFKGNEGVNVSSPKNLYYNLGNAGLKMLLTRLNGLLR